MRRVTQFLMTILMTSMVSFCISAEKEKKSSVDMKDPQAVAMAFLVALANKNSEEAIKYVIPEQRDDLRKAFKQGVPPIPQKPEIRVVVKRNGNQADVKVLNGVQKNPPLGLDMELKDGKWWIVK